MKSVSWSKDYRSALKDVLFIQGLIGILTFIAMNDLFFDVWWRAMAAYWGSLVVIVFKRSNTPTQVDLFLIKWGFFLLLFITPVLSVLMWRHIWSTF